MTLTEFQLVHSTDTDIVQFGGAYKNGRVMHGDEEFPPEQSLQAWRDSLSAWRTICMLARKLENL